MKKRILILCLVAQVVCVAAMPPSPDQQAMPGAGMLPHQAPPAVSLTPQAIPNVAVQTAITGGADIEKLNANLDEISKLKASLKDSLKDFGSKIQQAYKDMADAKKLSFEILSKGSTAEAQANLDKVNNTLQSLKTLQADISQQQAQKFDAASSRVQVLIDESNSLIKSMKDKMGIAATPASASTTSISAAVATSSSGVQPSSTVTKALVKDESIIHTVFERMGDFFEGVFILIGKGFDKVKFWISPGSGQEQANDALKKKVDTQSVTALTPSVPASPQPMMPPPPGIPGMPVPQDQNTLQSNANLKVDEMSGVLKKIDENLSELNKKLQVVDEKHAGVLGSIKNEPAVKLKLSSKFFEEPEAASEPVWKKYTMKIFGQFLDVVEVVARYTKVILIKIYNFIMDVVIKPIFEAVKKAANRQTEQKAREQVAVTPSLPPQGQTQPSGMSTVPPAPTTTGMQQSVPANVSPMPGAMDTPPAPMGTSPMPA